MPLSDIAVRTLKPRERAYKVYDRDGLFLLVNPGGSKLWRWRYRFNLNEKLMALGEYLGRGLRSVKNPASRSAQADPSDKPLATSVA